MFENFLKGGKFNPITASEMVTAKLPGPLATDTVRRKMLDVFLNLGIPFNRWLGLKIKTFTPDKVTIESPPTILRRNHVGTAHACALALMGEYPAGLLVAQHYSFNDHRIIIGKLEIEYHKAGRGLLTSTALAPGHWPEVKDGETWLPMESQITDESGQAIATCRTNWQIKTWARIEANRKNRN